MLSLCFVGALLVGKGAKTYAGLVNIRLYYFPPFEALPLERSWMIASGARIQCSGSTASLKGDGRFLVLQWLLWISSLLVPARVCAVPHLKGRTAAERRSYGEGCGCCCLMVMCSGNRLLLLLFCSYQVRV
jgi:hypothetical protein